MGKEDKQAVCIDGALYRELRDYCDTNGIRLVDFIEDSLETAIYRREMEGLLSDAERLQDRVKGVENAAIHKGFAHGVLAATMALSGDAVAAERLTPAEVTHGIDYRPVAGGQLFLFGDPQKD